MNSFQEEMDLLQINDYISVLDTGPVHVNDIRMRALAFTDNLRKLYSNHDKLATYLASSVHTVLRDIESIRNALNIKTKELLSKYQPGTATEFIYENFIDEISFETNPVYYKGYKRAYWDSVGHTIGPALNKSISCVRFGDKVLASATVIKQCGGFSDYDYGLQNILDGNPYSTWFIEASSTHPINVLPSWSPKDSNGNYKMGSGVGLVLDIDFFQSRLFNTISIDPLSTSPFYVVNMECISEDGAVDSLMDSDDVLYLDGPTSIDIPWGKTIAGMYQHNVSDRAARGAKLRLYLYQPYYILLGNNIRESDRELTGLLQMFLHPPDLSDLLSRYDENYPGYRLYLAILSDMFEYISATHTQDKPNILAAINHAIDKYISTTVNKLFYLKYSIGIKDIDITLNHYLDHGLYVSNRFDISNSPRKIDINLEYSALDGIVYDKYEIPESISGHNNFIGQTKYFSHSLAKFNVIVDETFIATLNYGSASDINYTSNIIEAYLSVNDSYSWEDFPITLGRPIYLYSQEASNPLNGLYMAALSHDSIGRINPGTNVDFTITCLNEEFQPYAWRFYPDTGTVSSTGGLFYTTAKVGRFDGSIYTSLTYNDFIVTARLQASGSGEINYTSATFGITGGPLLPYIACHFYTDAVPRYASQGGFVMGVDISGTAFLMRGASSLSFLARNETGLDMSSSVRHVSLSCINNRAMIFIDNDKCISYDIVNADLPYGQVTETTSPTSGKIRTVLEAYSGVSPSFVSNGFLTFHITQYSLSYPDVNILSAPYVPNRYVEEFNMGEIRNNSVKLARVPYVDLALIDNDPSFNANVGLSSGMAHPLSIRFIDGENIIYHDQNAEEYYFPTMTVVIPKTNKKLFTQITDKIYQSPHNKWDGDKVWLDVTIELSDSEGNPGIITDLSSVNISSGGYSNEAVISYGPGMGDYITMPHLSMNYSINFDEGYIEFTDSFIDLVSSAITVYGAYSHLSYKAKSLDRKTPYIWNLTDYRSSTQRSLRQFDPEDYPVYEFIHIGDSIKFNMLPSNGTMEVTYGSLAPDLRLVLKLKNSGAPPFISAYSVLNKSESF